MNGLTKDDKCSCEHNLEKHHLDKPYQDVWAGVLVDVVPKPSYCYVKNCPCNNFTLKKETKVEE